MKRTLILSFLFLSSLSNLFAQNWAKDISLDTVTLRCCYRQLAVMDTLNNKRKLEDMMLLDIGNHSSKYHDFYRVRIDSLVTALRAQNKSQEEIANTIVLQKRGSMTVNYTLYKGYPTGKITLVDYFGLQYNIYEELMQSPRWKLSKDTLTVLGYLCKKATTFFRGRNYEAWYAPELPINDGPWKLSGLPGLILKANDDKGHYSFECISIETPSKFTPIRIAKSRLSAKRISKDAYNKAKQSYMNNSDVFISGNPLISNMDLSPSQKEPYNPIELSEN